MSGGNGQGTVVHDVVNRSRTFRLEPWRSCHAASFRERRIQAARRATRWCFVPVVVMTRAPFRPLAPPASVTSQRNGAGQDHKRRERAESRPAGPIDPRTNAALQVSGVAQPRSARPRAESQDPDGSAHSRGAEALSVCSCIERERGRAWSESGANMT